MRSYLFIALLLPLSCSQFNTESQDYYFKDKPMRHGIIPLSMSELKQKRVVSTPRPIRKSAAKRGEVLYKANCLSCHGPQGLGDGPMGKNLNRIPRNLAEVVKKVPNFKFFMLVSQWKGEMPGWKNALSKQNLSDLEEYIRQLAHK